MAVADYDTLERMLDSPRERIPFCKNVINLVSSRLASHFTTNPLGGTAPTTAAVPARDITGAVGQQNGGGSALRIAGMHVTGIIPGTWLLCDRLSHQGGLSGTVTTAQTTNLPTAALTRYTDGAGVFAALEIHTQIGTTATTVTVSYTNQAGTAGQTSPAVVFGGTAFREASRVILIPLSAADTGIRSVESVTVLASTGTAGAFGVVLFKPLLYVPVSPGDGFIASPALGTMGGGLPEILDDACLYWQLWNSAIATVTNSAFTYDISFAED